MLYALRLQEGECRETGLPRRACCLTAAIGGADIDNHILQLGAAAIRRKQHAADRLVQMRRLRRDLKVQRQLGLPKHSPAALSVYIRVI